MESLAIEMGNKATIVRMDEGLYERLKSAAKRKGESLNKFMVSALEKSVTPVFPRLSLKDYPVDASWDETFKPLSGAYPDEMDWKKAKLEYLQKKYGK